MRRAETTAASTAPDVRQANARFPRVDGGAGKDFLPPLETPPHEHYRLVRGCRGTFPVAALSCGYGAEGRALGESPGRIAGLGEHAASKLDETVSDREPLEHTKTILICEDEPALRELVRASLDGGYRFAEASDGYVALKLAQELAPDAVILDLMLPGLSGLDVLAGLREDERLRHTRVLVVTAWSESHEDIVAAGADDFLRKPFDPDVLKAKLENLLDGS
jgi:CheY-like chemotaxis protein